MNPEANLTTALLEDLLRAAGSATFVCVAYHNSLHCCEFAARGFSFADPMRVHPQAGVREGRAGRGGGGGRGEAGGGAGRRLLLPGVLRARAGHPRAHPVLGPHRVAGIRCCARPLAQRLFLLPCR